VLGMMRKEKGKVIGQRGVTTLGRVSCAVLCTAAVPILRHYRTRGPTRAAAGCASDTTLALRHRSGAPLDSTSVSHSTTIHVPTRAQTIPSFVHLSCKAKELKQQATLRIESHLKIKRQNQ